MAFITGANGMLGTHLAYTLLSNDEQVYALKRKNSDLSNMKIIFELYTQDASNLLDKIHWIDGDVLDFHQMDEIIAKHQQVYHTAALVSFHKSDHDKIMDTNVQGTINIAQACIKNNARLIYCSSIASLGRGMGVLPTTENDYRTGTYKSSVYSESKFIAEQEIWRAIAEGLNAVIINPSVIIGPGDWSKSSAQLFKTVSKGLRFYTNGSNGYVDVRDVAEIMQQLMHSNIHSERFILSAENVSYKKLFSEIANALNLKPPTILANKWMSELSWRLMSMWAFLSHSTPLLTKETAKSANTYYQYSSDKIMKSLNYKFIPINASINHAAKAFIKQSQ